MEKEFRSCTGFGLSPVRFIAGFLRAKKRLPSSFGFSDSDFVLTYQGRYAIHLICSWLGIGKGDEVLAPAYNCGAEIDPFVWAGAKVVFYRIDDRARLDTRDILDRITPATKLIYVSHFFGWPQEIKDLTKKCREKGLYLVEDCAQCLFSRGPKNTIGRIGDAAIYSFVKSLPLPDGGAVVLNRKFEMPDMGSFQQPPYRLVFLNSLPLIKKWFMNSNHFWQRFELTRRLFTTSWKKGSHLENNEIGREMPLSNYFDARKIGWDISRVSRNTLRRVNPRKIFETRRRNYRYLLEALSGLSSIQILYPDLPDGVCPLSFPLFVDNRARWTHALEERGILVGGWPSYHRGFDWTDFPEARRLKDDLLTLPVHQGLSLTQMDYIARSVKSISRGI